jgi:hypothetical protein
MVVGDLLGIVHDLDFGVNTQLGECSEDCRPSFCADFEGESVVFESGGDGKPNWVRTPLTLYVVPLF